MKKILIILVFFNIYVFAAVDANLEIIKKVKTLPKIVVSLASDSVETDILEKVKKTLEKDFLVSGHFNVTNSEIKTSYESSPDLITLSNLGIDLYMNIYANNTNEGKYSLQFKLYDINAKQIILSKTLNTSQLNRYPFLAHRMAIAVNDFFQAPSIAWMDKFVVFSVYKGARKADIMIGDYTLAFTKRIVSGGLNIFPKWANSKQKSIYYTTYNYNKPALIKLNIFSREKEIIMKSDGMIACSDVNSKGSKILITASPNAQPDIYLYDLKTKSKKRITKYSGIDVGGQFIENDSRIVFISDRLGYPNIFAKTIGSSGVEKLVYHSKNNSSATTYKNKIVYSSKDQDNEFSKRNFNLFMMSINTGSLDKLTSNGINQFPKFSVDGESLLFIKNYKGNSSLGIIRLIFNKTYLFPLNIGRIQSIDW